MLLRSARSQAPYLILAAAFCCLLLSRQLLRAQDQPVLQGGACTAFNNSISGGNLPPGSYYTQNGSLYWKVTTTVIFSCSQSIDGGTTPTACGVCADTLASTATSRSGPYSTPPVAVFAGSATNYPCGSTNNVTPFTDTVGPIGPTTWYMLQFGAVAYSNTPCSNVSTNQYKIYATYYPNGQQS